MVFNMSLTLSNPSEVNCLKGQKEWRNGGGHALLTVSHKKYLNSVQEPGKFEPERDQRLCRLVTVHALVHAIEQNMGLEQVHCAMITTLFRFY